MTIAAYVAGATDVHIYWRAGGSNTEPDFAAAGHDYADSRRQPVSPKGDVEAMREALKALLAEARERGGSVSNGEVLGCKALGASHD